MTPTGPLHTTSHQRGLSGGPAGLGFTQNIERAFQQSTNGKVRAKIFPDRILDTSYYAQVVVPTAGGTNIKNKQTFVEADLNRSALEFLKEDTGLSEIEVLGPAQTNGSSTGGGNGNGNGEAKQAGFLQRNWPWLLGGGAVVLVGTQLLARSGRRKMEQAASQPAAQSAARANADDEFEEDVEEILEAGEETIEELEEETEEALPESLEDRENAASDPNNSAEFWIARATVDPDEMDRGNVHRTSMASNIASLDMEDQRRIASNLAVAPGGKVTVWKNASSGLNEQKTFTWDPSNGFSPTS